MKNLFTKQPKSLDEIIFEGRNQAYGAYDLRMQSDRMLTKSLFVGVSLFAGLAIIPLVISKITMSNEVPKGYVPELPQMIEIENVIFEEKEKEKPVSVPEQKVLKTVDTRVPTPTREAKVETKPATIHESENAIRGISNTDGEVVTQIKVPDILQQKIDLGDANNKGTKELPKTKNTSDIVLKVDENADFIGGIPLFREKVMQNFDISNFEGNGETLKAVVTFVVEKNGSISNIKVEGEDVRFNKETEQVIKKIGGKWKPAKANGELVRSYFRFPVSMRFE